MVVEFQPIVLAAGRSSPLEQLITTPKALIQVGNFPLIYYPLQWLKKNGFEQAIITVSEATKNDIFLALAPYFENELELDFFCVPDDEEFGTADTLRLLHNHKKISTDMLILGCDLIADFSLQNVANVWRMHNASLTVVYHSSLGNELIVPGPKSKKSLDREIVGVEPSSNRLICTASEADIDESLSVPRYLINRYPRLRICTSLQDSHVYLLKRWILEMLVINENISSIRTELVPQLIKKQHRSTYLSTDHGLFSSPSRPLPSSDQDAATMSHAAPTVALDKIAAESRLELFARHLSVWSDHTGDMEDAYFRNSIRCYAYTTGADEFCLRVNTIAAYCEVNRQIPRLLYALHPAANNFEFIHHNATLEGKAQVGPDSIVGEGTTIQDKVSVKKSVIGRNCTISEKAKISGCVIMDQVVVEESCNLHGCIIASQCRIGGRSDLKDCLMGQGFEVQAGSKHSNDSLTDVDRLMEY